MFKGNEVGTQLDNIQPSDAESRSFDVGLLRESKDFWDNLLDSPSEDKDTILSKAPLDTERNPKLEFVGTISESSLKETKDFWDALYSSFKDNQSVTVSYEEKDSSDTETMNKGENVEKIDSIEEKIEKTIGTSEGISNLIENHPEKAELWKSQLEALEILNDPNASPVEIRSAQAKLSSLKGQIMEFAVKDALTEAGFDVEPQQRVVEGENGGTKPDVIAVNNTDRPIEVLGVSILPGETLSIECKCGGSAYMTNQLNNHIPNQLSGHQGTKMLLATSDIKDTPEGLATNVCDKYEAKLVALDVSVSTVEKAIKEVVE